MRRHRLAGLLPHFDRDRPVFGRLSLSSTRTLADTLRSEKVGCLILLGATIAALVWANIPGAGYAAVRATRLGPAALHLDLTVAQWAADGLLTVFFLVVGLELKREFTVGEFDTPEKGTIPIVAAIGGMAVPAALYVAVNLALPGGSLDGWAIPAATDTAFAVAILAVVNSHLPSALRAFLLSLAVVDDVLAITVIAVFFTHGFSLPALLGSLAVIAVFGVLVQRRITRPWLLVPIALVAWALMHASGVHATLVGVLIGLVVPARTRPGEEESVTERFEHRLRPYSTGIAVPAFALFAAGVVLRPETFGAVLRDPVALGVVLGLVLGKPLGIAGATYLAARFTRAHLDPGLTWRDVIGVAAVGGIGFTVSLLIGELAFGDGTDRGNHVKVAILVGSILSAAIGAAVLLTRQRAYCALEEAAAAADDAPDGGGRTS